MTEILNLDSLLAQLVLALGAAMLIGNGLAIYHHRKGRHPKHAAGPFRAVRAWWLSAVGLVMTAWGLASLF